MQLPVSAAEVLRYTKAFVASEIPAVRQLSPRPPRPRERIRLAYVSGDFRQHPVADLVAQLFEQHDRARFEVHAVSYGPDDRSSIRARIVRAADRFHDVRGGSDSDAAVLLRELGADIAIDLTGYTEMSRPGILVRRPAPIQVSYLGLLGTMGADFIDYVIADRVVLPPDQQPFYAERIVRLPDCYLVGDRAVPFAARTPARTEVGLPAAGVVFCSFNSAYKFQPDVFAVWMRLLQAVDGSVLWLLAADQSIATNLRRAAQAHGVDPARLVFAPRLALAEHMARQTLADLFLDTLPYNAGATATLALWASVPVL